MYGIKTSMRVTAMLVLLVTIAFTWLSYHTLFTRPTQPKAPLDEFVAYLNKRIPALMDAYDVPGLSIALVTAGECAFAQAYGYASVESGEKLTTDTLLRVQSISKAVTAWGVMRLVEQRRIELDLPITEYIKSWEFPRSEYSPQDITVRQLLSHTAGLPLGDVLTIYPPNGDIPSLRENLAKEAIIAQAPGSVFAYSNVGFNLLELLIEDVTGVDFAQYMHEEVLTPLGMTNSTLVWSSGITPPIPNGYGFTGESVPVYVYPEKASGGLFATAEDIARFISSGMTGLVDNKVLSKESIQLLYTPSASNIGIYNLVFDSYGLGYYLENLSNGNLAVSHGGQGTGIMTHFHAVPAQGVGIVILTNSQRSWPLIASLLRDWAAWSGLPRLGMERIIWGQNLIWLVVGLVWVVVVLQLRAVLVGLTTKARQFAPFSKRGLPVRLVQACVSFGVIAGLLWCTRQDYLFITSVFPVVSVQLGFSLLVHSLVNLFVAMSVPYPPIYK